MFIFIGGTQPKTTTLDDTPRMCPSCGLYQMRRMRTDNYLALFFIPLFPISRGKNFYRCQSCGTISSHPHQTGREMCVIHMCPHCGQETDPEFRFCPHCGGELAGKGE